MEPARKKIDPYYCTDRKLNTALKINLDSHHTTHKSSKNAIILFNYLEIEKNLYQLDSEGNG